MANNDSIIGGILVGIGAITLIVETYLLIILPLRDGAPFKDNSNIYWGMAIPLFLGIAGVLAILIWIGWTMIQTPPPEAWDFDDLEDELDDDDDDKPKKAAASGSSSDISSIEGVTKSNMTTLVEAGFDTKGKIAAASVTDLSSLKGIGKVSAEKIIENAKN